MKKTIVIYQSKYGYTKKYARMLASLLDCPVYNRKSIHSSELEHYDCIVYGGPIYVGGVSGIDLLERYQSILKEKEVIVFTCGLTDPNELETIEHRENHMKAQLSMNVYNSITTFHLRGGINYKKLPLAHRFVLFLINKLHLKDDISSLDTHDKELVNTYGKVVDFTDIEALKPIIEHIKKDR